MDSGAFTALLGQLLSADGQAREEATRLMESLLEANPDQGAQLLCAAVTSGADVNQRQLASVMLRQLARRHDRWSRVDDGVKAQLRPALISALESESEASVCRGIVYAIVAFPSPELLQCANLVPSALRHLEACEPAKRTAYLLLLNKVAEFAFPLVQAQIGPVTQALSQCIAQNQDLDCKLAAADAICSVMLSSPQPTDLRELIEGAIPHTLEGVFSGYSNDSDAADLASKALESMQALTAKCIWAFDKNLGETCLALLRIVDAVDLEDESRCLALNVFVDIFRKRGRQIGQDKGFMEKLLLLLIRVQCQDSHWESEWQDDISPVAQDMMLANVPGLRGSAIEALRVVAGNAADPDAFIKQLFGTIGPALRSPTDYRERQAALTVICAVAEPLGKPLRGLMSAVIDNIKHLFSDPDQHVVFMAAVTVFEFVSSPPLKGSFGKENGNPEHGAFFVEALAQILESDKTVDIVRCAANLSLAELLNPTFENVTDLSPEMEMRLLKTLVKSLSSGASLPVKEDAMIALSSIAKVAGRGFGQFYDDLMPGIKQFISNPECAMNTPNACNKEGGEGDVEGKANALRASAMACIAAIAEAVGGDRFARDADEILGLLLSAPADRLMFLDGFFDFCQSVCKVLGSRFVPFLDRVVSVALATAKADAEVKVEDIVSDVRANSQSLSPAGGDGLATDGTVSFVQELRGKGTYRVTANIFVFQARLQAITAIGSMAEVLGADFAPYLETCFSTIVPAISDKLNFEASICAAQAASSLLHAAWLSLFKSGQSMEQAQKMLVAINMAILAGLQLASEPSSSGEDDDPTEFDINHALRSGLATAFERCVRICWTSGAESPNDDGKWPAPLLVPPENLVPQMVTVLRDVLMLSVQRRVQAADSLAQAGYDEADIEEELEEINEMEEDFSTDVIDAIGYLLKISGPRFFSTFEAVLEPLASQLIQAGNPPAIRHNALCMYIDAIEFCGPEAAAKYGPTAIPAMCNFLMGDSVALSQCCAYGLGVAASSAPAVFGQFTAKAAQGLVQLIQGCDSALASGDDEYQLVGENAVSALGRVLTSPAAGQNSFPAGKLWPVWLEHLPLRADQEEAYFSHRLLCQIATDRSRAPTLPDDCLPLVLIALAGLALEARNCAAKKASGASEGDEEDEEDAFEPLAKADLEKLHGVVSGFASSLTSAQFQLALQNMSAEARDVCSSLIQAP